MFEYRFSRGCRFFKALDGEAEGLAQQANGDRWEPLGICEASYGSAQLRSLDQQMSEQKLFNLQESSQMLFLPWNSDLWIPVAFCLRLPRTLRKFRHKLKLHVAFLNLLPPHHCSYPLSWKALGKLLCLTHLSLLYVSIMITACSICWSLPVSLLLGVS